MKDKTLLKISLLTIILAPIINGFVLSKLWLWFITPIFTINPITIIQAIGLAFIWNFMNPTISTNKENNNKDYQQKIENVITDFIGRAIGALGFGWILTQFM
jgi:hypothetical protein